VSLVEKGTLSPKKNSLLFLHMFRTIPERAINVRLKMNGYYSLNGNGWNLVMEIVIYND
jgi:hypothetical protein